MTITARPCGSSALTGITTAGVGGAVAIPDGSVDPFFPALQIKIWVSAEAYVCLGDVISPDASPPSRKVIQQAETEEVYTLNGMVEANQDHVWIYAVAATISADVSFFG